MFPYYNYSELFKPEEVICYLRKSRTDDPALTVEEVLEKHEIRLDEWAEQNLGAKVPQNNRFYEVVSGEKISERPEFNKVLRLIENPQYKAILCFDTARLSRGDLEDAGRLIKLLRYTSTYVITVSPFEFYDLSQERDRDLFERALKRGNEYLEYFKKVSNNGRLLSVSQGNYIGSVPPYGYNKTYIVDGKKKCPTLEINQEQADVVRLIFDLYVNKKWGKNNICHYLESMKIKPAKGGYWQPDTLSGILTNIHYIGMVRWNRKKGITVVENGEIKTIRPTKKDGDYLIYKGKHEPIITEELFCAAQDEKGKRPKTKTSFKLKNPLAGLLFCKCGRSMEYRTNKNKGGESEHSRARMVCQDQVHCHTGSVLYDEIIEKVCAVLEESIADFQVSLKTKDVDFKKTHTRLIINLEKKLKVLEERELTQWEQQSHPDPSQRMPPEIFKLLNERLLEEKKETKEALERARESIPKDVDYEEKILRFKDALEALKNPNADPELQNALLKACIERIDYFREKPERVKSQQAYIYDKTKKRTVTKSPLSPGGNWTKPQIILDFKLKE